MSVTLDDLQKRFSQSFAQWGDPDINPRQEARLLIQGCLGLDPLAWVRQGGQLLTEAQIKQCDDAFERRQNREPLSRILGEREFWSLPFWINEATLDPRPDSECLIEAVLAWCDRQPEKREAPYRILDLGTGSGCLLITLLSELPQAVGIGVDIQEQALRLATQNASRHNVGNRFQAVCSTWADSLSGKFDIILTNPPYIETSVLDTLAPEVRLYDPVQALDGGTDGLLAYRQIVPTLPALLNQSGFVICEIGVTQEYAIETLLKQSAFLEVSFHYDLSSRVRCVSAQWV